MPDDLRTTDTASSIATDLDTGATDRGIDAATSAIVADAPVEGLSATDATETPGEPRVEVTCGGCRRGLRVRASYLGRFVVCQHCGVRFLAQAEAGRPVDGGLSETGPSGRSAQDAGPPGPRDGGPALGPGGFEKLAARIEREFRLTRSLPGARDLISPAGTPHPARPPRPMGSSENQLGAERDSALAEVARLTAELDGLLDRLTESEARIATLPAPSGPAGDQGNAPSDRAEQPPAAEVTAARIAELERELDQVRGELDSAGSRHQGDRDRLERELAEATSRRAEGGAGHPESIERAVLEERSRAEADLRALRAQLEFDRARLAVELTGHAARAEHEARSAEEAGQAREAAVRLAEDLRQEQGELLARIEQLQAGNHDLQGRLAALEGNVGSAAEEAERRREEIEVLTRDLQRTHLLDEAAIGEVTSLKGQIEELRAALERAAEQTELDRKALEGDLEGRLAAHSEELAEARGREEAARREVAALGSEIENLRASLALANERLEADRKTLEGDRDERLARLSGELAEARSREDGDAGRIAALEARVEGLVADLGREATRLEAERKNGAARLEAVERQAGLDRASHESEVATLRGGIRGAEEAREAERSRASGLAQQAEVLAARLALAEPALAALPRLEAELARLTDERDASRAAPASRHVGTPPEPIVEASATPPPPLEMPASSAANGVHDSGNSEVEAATDFAEFLHADPGPCIKADLPPDVAKPEVFSPFPGSVPVPGATKIQEPARPPSPARRRREPGGEPSIVLRGVSKEYRRDRFRIPVLEGLDLSVEPGEFLGLMGPSGSGKTTLLNLIAGLDQATAGSVVVHGQELTGLSEAALTRWRASNVGFVFQMYNLIPVMTAQRNVELPLLLTRLSGRQRRENARTALRIVGLEGREDHYPRQLSGGQEQRVSIARAIVTDPQLIVADEPTGDLDRKSAGEILDLLGSLNRDFHKTIVMVTHDPLAAQRATRTLHLDKGKLVGDTVQPRIWGGA